MKRIAVLGSTGSIGTSTLAVIEAFPDDFEVVALAAGSNIELLRRQMRRHRPATAAVIDPKDAKTLGSEFPDCRVIWGEGALSEIATQPDVDTVFVAVVGVAGLEPTLAAVKAGREVALANKESLVVAGELVMEAVRHHGAQLLPVDSEHSAIHQLVIGRPMESVARLILTASGGPFRTWSAEAMAAATVDDALDHPTWRMGAKISVDSATMMNKGLEIIEAHHLFGVPEENIDVLVHPQSVIHSLVEFAGGSVAAQLSVNDMRLPIAHALWWPEMPEEPLPGLDFSELPPLTFEDPDHARFPALELARAALREGGEMPVALNAANEVAVAEFLSGRAPYPAVTATVSESLDVWSGRNRPVTGIDQVLAADSEVRKLAATAIMKYNSSDLGSEKRC